MAVPARKLENEAAVAAPAPSRPSRRSPPADQPARERSSRERRPQVRRGPRIGRSVMWIGIVGALLAGIVALNVAVLQLRVQRGQIGTQIAKIRAENEGLRAELSTAAAVGRVEALARTRLGLVDAGERTYLRLPAPPR
jgi:hypothetical protein